MGLEAEVDVSIVVPVYRNGPTLVPLWERIDRVLSTEGYRFEVIFVDDNCPDGSLEIARDLAAARAEVNVVALRRNVGQHWAVLTGLALSRGSWAVVMDADLQDPPEAIPRLLDVDESVMAVFAGRRGRYQVWHRMLTSRVHKHLLHLACGVPKDAGIYVALRRAMIDRILSLPAATARIVSLIGLTGMPTASVPVRREVRPSGSSAYSSWARLRSALAAYRCVAQTRLRPSKGPVVSVCPTDYLRFGRRFGTV